MKNFHIALEMWGGIFCLIAAFCISIVMGVDKNKQKMLVLMECVGAVLLFSDTFAWYYRGGDGIVGYYLLRVSNFLVFLMMHISVCLYNKYVHLSIPEKCREDADGVVSFVYIIAFIEIICLTLSQKYNFFYYFDENNVYHRNTYFWLSQMAGIVGMGADLYLLIKYRRQIGKKKVIPMIVYILLPILSVIVQIWVYGISLTNISIAVSLLLLFITSQLEQNEMIIEQQKGLSKMQIDMMVSQIEPHFMFNALSTIKWLCRTKPYEAENAIDEFSNFLRGNIDGIKAVKCIPFEKEMDYVENYIALEKKRFGDRVNIEYEISVSDFDIPAFTIQVLVENAIKHGITKKDDGGFVKISTDEQDNYYVITIEDDGVGFNVNKKPNDGRTHIGIENAKVRLQRMCNGDLYIKSKIGVGTTAVISIPKNK